jgi:hypothetical protein
LPCGRLPWSLAVGDIRANLDALAAVPDEPAELVTFKMWSLLRLGYHRQSLHDAVVLLGKRGHCSTAVEQAHKCGATAMKDHDQMGAESMRARAMALSMRPLVLPSQAAARLDRERGRLCTLARSQPSYITGRQAFLKAANETAQLLASQGRALPSGVHNKIMHTHGATWDATSEHATAKYEAYAEELREGSHERLAERRATIIEHMEQCRAQVHEEAPSVDQPFRMSACKFTLEQSEGLNS